MMTVRKKVAAGIATKDVIHFRSVPRAALFCLFNKPLPWPKTIGRQTAPIYTSFLQILFLVQISGSPRDRS